MMMTMISAKTNKKKNDSRYYAKNLMRVAIAPSPFAKFMLTAVSFIRSSLVAMPRFFGHKRTDHKMTCIKCPSMRVSNELKTVARKAMSTISNTWHSLPRTSFFRRTRFYIVLRLHFIVARPFCCASHFICRWWYGDRLSSIVEIQCGIGIYLFVLFKCGVWRAFVVKIGAGRNGLAQQCCSK